MDEKALFWIALICSLIGLAGVVAASLMIKPEVSSISSVKEMKEGTYAKISGNVINIRQTEKAAFLEVEDETGKITIVVFPDSKGFIQKEVIPPFLDKGSNISAEGKVSIYQGNPEIIAEKLER